MSAQSDSPTAAAVRFVDVDVRGNSVKQANTAAPACTAICAREEGRHRDTQQREEVGVGVEWEWEWQ